MSEPTNVDDLLDAIARVLIRAFVIGLLLLGLSFATILLGKDMIHDVHGEWFDLTPNQFDLVFYSVLAIGKTFLFLLFLAPYVSIRLVLRKRRS